MNDELSIFELRQYAFAPGGRDDAIDLFERHFISEQERVGAHVIGHFRDLDDPGRFVWIRGFRDMARRKAALETFYTSDVWYRHRDAVNEKMLDSDNVLLLTPMPGFARRIDTSAARNGAGVADRLVSATVWTFAETVSAETSRLFVDEVVPLSEEAGADVLAAFVTEPSENDYPRLPVREGENVLVWLARFGDARALADHDAALDCSPRWQDLMRTVGERLSGTPQRLRLAPCARSLVA